MPVTRVLLVEGNDDLHVTLHICEQHNVPQNFEVIVSVSKPELINDLPVRLKASRPGDVIGAMVDANGDISACWQSIRSILGKAGYENFPAAPDAAGTIVEPPSDSILARVGVWIMPNNSDSGMLEDFLLTMLPVGSILLEHAESAVDGIPSEDRLFTPAKRPKAVLHTFLAWQREPGLPYGTAIKSGSLDCEAVPAQCFAQWLIRLFGTTA